MLALRHEHYLINDRRCDPARDDEIGVVEMSSNQHRRRDDQP